MPMTAYAGMTREDLAAIYAFLRTQKPVINRVNQIPGRASYAVTPMFDYLTGIYNITPTPVQAGRLARRAEPAQAHRVHARHAA